MARLPHLPKIVRSFCLSLKVALVATLLFTIYFQLKKLFISLRVLLFFSSNWTTKRNLSETFSNGWRRKPDKIRTKRIASNSFPDAESRTSTLIRSCRNVTCKLSEISKKNILLKICSACYTQWRFFQWLFADDTLYVKDLFLYPPPFSLSQICPV